MSTWEQIRKANKARGMKPNGLYNKPKKSPLSDTPPVGEALKKSYRTIYATINVLRGKDLQPHTSIINIQ